MLFVNDTRIERVNAGGTDLQYVYQGTDTASHTNLQFCKIPSNYSSLNLDLDSISILQVQSTGTRSPGDKISNYAYVPSTSSLVVGKKYSYLIATAGERTAQRNLSDGTTINCRGYNSGDVGRIHNLTMSNVQSGSVVNNASYNFQGNFIYNPKLITAGNGSTANGHLIARNTFNVSDAGKGGIVVYIYEYTCLESLFAYAYARTSASNWVFNETVYSN
jgi:hypothetical protein